MRSLNHWSNSLAILSGTALLAVVGLAAVGPHRIDDRLPADRPSVLRTLGMKPSPSLSGYEIEVDPGLRAEWSKSSVTREYPRWLPATFRAGGRAYDVEVREEVSPSTRPEQSTWRVHFHGKERYRGVRDLTLAPARGAADAGEVAAADAARELGLLATPSGFASLRVNGADAGPVLWTQGRNSAVLMRLGYDPGEVLSLAPDSSDALAGPPEVARVEMARPVFADRDDVRYRTVAGKLRQLVEIAETADDAEFLRVVPQLLNIDKYVAWNALAWLYGRPSADVGRGVQWYFDPVTGLFEPMLPKLGRSAVPISGAAFAEASFSPIGSRLFRNPRYREQRNDKLWQLLNDRACDVAEAGIRQYRRLLPHLIRESERELEGEREIRMVLAANADWLRAVLSTSAPATASDVAMAEILGGRKWGFRALASGYAGPPQEFAAPSAILPALWASGFSGRGDRAHASVGSYSALPALPDRQVFEALVRASGLPFELRADELVLPAGTYTLSTNLVVPAEYRLTLEAGVSLRLAPGVSVLTFRGLTVRGTSSQPVRIQPADPDRPWGSFAVVRAPEVSHLEHVVVSGGSKSVLEGIDLAGQLAFNASDLVLRFGKIRGARGGEGLSIRRAEFDVAHTRFIENGLDGLDVEWSRGTVRDSSFVANGDDGLDMAGSSVRLLNSSLRGMGDKAVSAGEDSEVWIADSEILHSRIAVASKEGSRVEIARSRIIGNDVGISLYRGKPHFGGGQARAVSARFSENQRDIMIEPGSQLVLTNANDGFVRMLGAASRWLDPPPVFASVAE